ncbi:YceI family protein [uncultured Polaribacter sp.]|uniref:YceI family protein n=1 Tax=uncultured Polaribacter sp. TaxID=174711 RepID=UPI00260ACE75|nr:YceI family protein [uncultured Polaribacter sp.]
MNKIVSLLLFFTIFSTFTKNDKQYIARQGQVTFFSYTSVENIEAQNNQVLSIIDIENKEIAVSMLMRAFVFKKDLMYEHFNESYIESDLYPQANFKGEIIGFSPKTPTQDTVIKGTLTIHGVSKKVSIKTNITYSNNSYTLTGEFVALVNDFNIKIPAILTSNIAKTINLKFKFQYQPHEN